MCANDRGDRTDLHPGVGGIDTRMGLGSSRGSRTTSEPFGNVAGATYARDDRGSPVLFGPNATNPNDCINYGDHVMRTVVTNVVSQLLTWISIGPLLLMGLMITLIRGSGSCDKCSACPSTQPEAARGELGAEPHGQD
jgi:hypothetical protein